MSKSNIADVSSSKVLKALSIYIFIYLFIRKERLYKVMNTETRNPGANPLLFSISALGNFTCVT